MVRSRSCALTAAAVIVLVAAGWVLWPRPAAPTADAGAAGPEPTLPAATTAVTWSEFCAACARRPPAQCDEQQLVALIQRYDDALFGADAMPAADVPLARIEAEMRAAIDTRLPVAMRDDHRGYFEYLAARRAQLDSDPAALRAAVQQLEQFARSHPAVSFLAVDRNVLLADLQRALGDTGAALGTLQQVVIAADLDPKTAADQRSYRDCVLAEVLRETGRLDDAAAAVRSAMADAFRSRDEDTIAAALLCEQSLALTTGNFDESCATLRARLAEVGDQPSRRRSLLLLHLGYAESGLAGDDVAALDRALATLAEARAGCGGALRRRADIKRFDLVLRQGDLAAAERIRQDCAACFGSVAANATPSRDAGEFFTCETRLLLLRGAGADELAVQQQKQRAVLAALAREWLQQPAQRGGIGYLQLAQRREAVAAGVELELALAAQQGRSDGAERALQILLDLQACTSLARARGAPACSVREVQRHLLAPGGIVLAFVPTRAATLVFLVESDGRVRCSRLPGNLPADPIVREWLACLGQSPSLRGPARARLASDLDRLGRLVHDRCIPAEFRAAAADATALTVVGADLCSGLPFEALVCPSGALLGEVLAIDQTASLPLSVALTQTATPVAAADAAVLLVACTDPAFHSPATEAVGGFDLPRDLVAACLQQHGRSQSLVEAAATTAAFDAVRGQDFAVTHLVLHQVAGTDARAEAGLLLHDGIVWRHELQRPSSPLVIVSACGGGGGPSRVGEGDGFHSFVGTFLWNGARAVLASRRDLLANEHLAAMVRCHHQLAAGASPARAMQRARAEAATGTDLVARVQCAMFQVFGAGQEAVGRR